MCLFHIAYRSSFQGAFAPRRLHIAPLENGNLHLIWQRPVRQPIRKRPRVDLECGELASQDAPSSDDDTIVEPRMIADETP